MIEYLQQKTESVEINSKLYFICLRVDEIWCSFRFSFQRSAQSRRLGHMLLQPFLEFCKDVLHSNKFPSV